MRVVLGSDEKTALSDAVTELLQERGFTVELIGPPGGE